MAASPQIAQIMNFVAAVGVLDLVAMLYITWAAQSNTVGSGGTGGKIPPIVNLKPSSSNGGSSGSAPPKNDGCSAPSGSFVSR